MTIDQMIAVLQAPPRWPKPEPREWWINLYNYTGWAGHAYNSREQAQDSEPEKTPVKVREVIE